MATSPDTRDRPPLSLRERVLSVVILVGLAAVVVAVWRVQDTYNPEVNAPQSLALQEPRASTAPSQAGALDLARFVPEGFGASGLVETFDSETLSDKIDGKAETYLAAGFVRLSCLRFADAAGLSAEVFVFEMADHRAAYAVYSSQYRSGAEKVAVGEEGYRTSNALYFIQGPLYVELIGSAVQPHLLEAMQAFASNLAATGESASQPMSELTLLPAQGLIGDSAGMIGTAAFGFEPMTGVFTGRYQVNGQELTAFVTQRPTGAEAQQLADQYRQFLVSLGASERLGPVEAATTLTIADTTEIVLVRGPVVAGVHEAYDVAAAAQLAKLLAQHIEEMGNGRK